MSKVKKRGEMKIPYNTDSKNNKKWTNELLEELKKDWGVLPKDEIEIKYNVKYNTLKTLCSKFKIKSNRNHQKNPCCPIKYTTIREKEEEFIKDWTDGILTQKELVEKYKCPYTNITTRARFLNINRNTKLDNIDLDSLCEDYNGSMSVDDIQKKHNISNASINRLLKPLGILQKQGERNRKYDLDESYFDKINTEIKAYYLGLFYADGTNCEDRGYIGITLKEEDKHIIERLLKELNYNKPIYEIFNKKYNKKYCMIQIQSRYISNIFIKHGCMQNKSFKITFPYWLDKNLWNHFIRGYFDGDGCISISKKLLYKSSLSITGNLDFISEVQKILVNYCNINKTKLHKQGNVYSLAVSGKHQLSRVLQYMYKDSNVFLKRKHEKIQYLSDLKIINMEE